MSFEVSLLCDGSLIYGRNTEKRHLIKLLLSHDYNSQFITVICIVGPNGIGKTTMLHLINNDKRVFDAFERRLFIRISENCDQKRLMKDIIESLTSSPCDITEPETLEGILKDELINKKILFLLDAVERGKKIFWNNIWMLLSGAAKGSVVLATAQRNEVANVMGAIHCYQLKCLPDAYYQKIFRAKTFSGHDPNAYPALEMIGENLLGKCATNILHIKMLSGLLNCSLVERWWRDVSESDFWDMEKLGREEVLRVCFEFLPAHLKRCFAYCSLFPKEYIFLKHQLVRLWMSQGLIEPVVGGDLEDIGMQYFDELCRRSFLEHSPLHDAKEEKFVMHELIHDMAQNTSMKECFRFEDPLQGIPEMISHFSLVPLEYQIISPYTITKNAKDLLSFLVINRSAFQHNSILSPIVNLVELDDLFVKFRSIKTLDLSNTGIRELPNSVGLLRSLEYLGLNKTKIKNIPLEIRNLIYLQTLEAKGCNNLVELPECMSEMINLCHLDVTKKKGFVGMPVGIGKLTKLQSLATFNVGSDEMHCGIEELNYLNSLKGSLWISGIENVKGSLDAKKANLMGKGYLETLSLQWGCENTTYEEGDEDAETATQVLKSLQPSDTLRGLIIRNYVGYQFPFWMEDRSFSKLVSIVLDNFLNCSVFPPLGSLPSLRNLSIHKFYGIEEMEFPDSNSIIENENKFPSLEQLKIWEMYELKEWPEIRSGDFPRLNSLSINNCPLLRNIPLFCSLVEMSITNCIKLPEIPYLPSLESLKLHGLNNTSLNLLKNLPLLRKLEIGHCSELLFVNNLSWPSSLKKIRLIQCPKLDCLSDSFKKEYYSCFSVLHKMGFREEEDILHLMVPRKAYGESAERLHIMKKEDYIKYVPINFLVKFGKILSDFPRITIFAFDI
ncbi:hypothetical protein LUZ60_003565 [Juncus effusus]|nr:hypothetical protein LUZ60_003565 [Juncus effusus]